MATLTDVARRAQVTAATVSNVLRNPDKVRPETAERVMRAIRDLGYRPNLNGCHALFCAEVGQVGVRPKTGKS